MTTRRSADAGERGTRTPADVLDAALTLFSSRGYHGTSMSEIAQAVGIRVPSLYNHMSSKQGLLVEIVQTTTEQVWTDYLEAVTGVSGSVARLHAAARVYALRHATNPREALVVNRDVASLEEPARTRVFELRRCHEAAVRELISEGIAEGAFFAQPPMLVSFAILEMCVSIARWFRPGGEISAESVADHYARFAVTIALGEVR